MKSSVARIVVDLTVRRQGHGAADTGPRCFNGNSCRRARRPMLPGRPEAFERTRLTSMARPSR
jgi:hypothetical protein